MIDSFYRQTVHGEKGILAQFSAKGGVKVARHSHHNEAYFMVTSGAVKFIFDDGEVGVVPGYVVVIPANVPLSFITLEDAVFVDFFAPVREDWLRGKDQYLRK